MKGGEELSESILDGVENAYPAWIERLVALDLCERCGAPISEKTLDRYRAAGIIREKRDGMWVYLNRADVEAAAKATATVNGDGTPMNERFDRIRELSGAAERAGR